MAERTDAVRIERRDGAAIVVVDRPARHNALDRATLRALARAFRSLRGDETVRGVVLTGSPPAFMAGGDLRDFANDADARAIATLGRCVTNAMQRVGVPVLAAIDGDAHGGGCELAAACDVRVMARGARLHWVQGRLGLTTGWGGGERLARLVGAPTALTWLAQAATVDAMEAHRAGFVQRVAEPGEAVGEAVAWLAATGGVSRATVQRMLRVMRSAGTRDGASVERGEFANAWQSREHADAVQRFLDRPRDAK